MLWGAAADPFTPSQQQSDRAPRPLPAMAKLGHSSRVARRLSPKDRPTASHQQATNTTAAAKESPDEAQLPTY